MAFSNKKNILLFTLLIIIVAAATGYYLYNKGPVNIQTADAEKVNALELYNAFISDTSAAQKRFSGKILLVSGNISQSSTNQQGQTILLLKTSAGAGFINCTLEKNNNILLKENQEVQVKGFCSGLGAADEDLGLQPDLYLERCIVQ